MLLTCFSTSLSLQDSASACKRNLANTFAVFVRELRSLMGCRQVRSCCAWYRQWQPTLWQSQSETCHWHATDNSRPRIEVVRSLHVQRRLLSVPTQRRCITRARTVSHACSWPAGGAFQCRLGERAGSRQTGKLVLELSSVSSAPGPI